MAGEVETAHPFGLRLWRPSAMAVAVATAVTTAGTAEPEETERMAFSSHSCALETAVVAATEAMAKMEADAGAMEGLVPTTRHSRSLVGAEATAATVGTAVTARTSARHGMRKSMTRSSAMGAQADSAEMPVIRGR